MQNDQQIKETVREKYTAIANQERDQNLSSCCGATASCGKGEEVYHLMAEDYQKMEGYSPEADLGLGCGLPTEFAQIREGDTVIDLGSGAGNDCFVARKLTGASGKVIGIDFTPAMIERARINADTLGFTNVEFRQGDIEQIPVAAERADVVISNCVLNLVPNKVAVMSEIFRVLKPGGHFSISDIVLEGALPADWKSVAELYAGCVSGAIQKADYLSLIQAAGFTNIEVQKDKTIHLPDEILHQHLDAASVDAFKKSGARITSITVFAQKPACTPGAGCC